MPPPPRYPVGADAVVIAPFADGDRVLLVRRGAPPPGWAIPGGFVEPHEDLPDAARRELREETGIALDSLVHIGAYGHPDRDPRRGRIIGIVFGARLAAPPAVTAGDDAADARWFCRARGQRAARRDRLRPPGCGIRDGALRRNRAVARLRVLRQVPLCPRPRQEGSENPCGCGDRDRHAGAADGAI